jgi:hypothetical protein
MATNPKKEKLALLRVEQLKPKAKRLGVKLTNPSGNAKTKAQLINAIVKAEEKKPAAKRRAVKKTLAPVVEGSVRRDRERQALPPGRRVSKNGKVYNERRANRADIKQGAVKGQMLGERKYISSDYIKEIPKFYTYCVEFYNEETGIYPIASPQQIKDAVNYFLETNELKRIYFDSLDRELVRILLDNNYELL